MKFTDGFWKLKPGVSMIPVMEVKDKFFDGKTLTVFCSDVLHAGRAQAVDRPMITIEFSAPREDVIGVKLIHHDGSTKKLPAFDIFEDENAPEFFEDDASIVFCSGATKVIITKSPYSLAFYKGERLLTKSLNKCASYMKTDIGPFMREQLTLDVGECVYGLGERFTPFVKNGQVVDMWNEDGGTASEISYKNIPFYVTNRGVGVFVNTPAPVSFEVASEVVSRVQMSLAGEKLQYYVIGGDDIKEVISNFCSLTGKPALPPAWSFGLWLTTSFTTDYDEKTVSSFIDGMAQRDIPLRVFHFDCYWMKEYEWCNFTWDERVFPDPTEMLRRYHEKGLKICCWINPYIAQKSPLFKEGRDNGYLLKRANGDVWQWDMWQAGMGLVDFTNPDATKWYLSKLEALLDMGVDCFKTDFGERIPTDVVYFDGSDPVYMHNYYTHLYNKAVFDLLESKLGKNEACLFARSATAGGQRYPVHWGGDCVSEYYSMAESLRAGLSLTSSGFAFWSHDISGFENTATPDLYKRWAAFGLLSTHSRLHGSKSYRVPWLFDDEACDVVKFFTNLKCRLMPYIYAMAVNASKTGVPVMRSMAMEFFSDPACDSLDRQYMLGDNILVAPVFSENKTAQWYLPDGTWTHLLSQKSYKGGRWYKEEFDYFSLPLFARENSIIVTGYCDTLPDYDYTFLPTATLYELNDKASSEVYDIDGKLKQRIDAKREGSRINISLLSPAKGMKIEIKAGDISKTVQIADDRLTLTIDI
ncbi:MAG: alpha-xylosidase [Clostridiales bacterium]|nr:alpha-xylosidase [Clostridiales bacterium]